MNEKLNKIIENWEFSIYDDYKTKLEKLTYALESGNFENFLKINYIDINEEVKSLINKYHPEWLESRECVKKLIIRHSVFCILINDEILNDFSLWVEIIKENDKDVIYNMKYPKTLFDFNLIKNNETLLDLFLSKVLYLREVFKNIDVVNLADKYYNDVKYVYSILNEVNPKNINLIIPKIPKNIIMDENIWKCYHFYFIKYYKEKIVDIISKDFLFTPNTISVMLNNDIDVFNMFYNEIINNEDIMKSLINWGHYDIIKFIKDEDFSKVKNIIIDKLENLEMEVGSY